MKKNLFFAASVLSIFFSACYKTQTRDLYDQVKAKGEIVIALEGTWEPWNYHDEQNQLVGYDVDVAKEICRRMEVRPKFVEVEWERAFSCLEKRECDIVISGVEVTPERKERFYFSTPYAYDRTVIIVKKETDDVKNFEDLLGKTSANALNSTYDELAKKYGAYPIIVDTFDETMSLLLQNRADTTINSILVFYDYIKENPNAPLKIAAQSDSICRIAIPCRKSAECLTLLMEINNAIESMKDDGTLKQISLKYFEQDVTK